MAMHRFRSTHRLVCMFIMILFLSIPAQQGFASSVAQSAPGVVDVSFEQLNKSAITLFSPIDHTSFDFVLPYRWQMVGEQNYVDIHYSLTYEGYDPAVPEEVVDLNATVDVFINNTLLGSFTPQLGDDITIQMPIPNDLLNDPDSNRHRVRIAFRTENCENPRQARMIIRPTSLLHLTYELLPLELNLAAFPRPLVQERFTPETVALIIPDAYNDADLSAAASLAATLGSQVSRDTVTTILVPAAQATPELLADKSAIIIGTPDRNSFLNDLYARGLLPTTLSPETAEIMASASQPIMLEDGILQLMVSDVNPEQVYLIVTASTDIGVYRAARALSMQEPRYGLIGSLGIVAAVSELDIGNTALLGDVVTLNDLDYFDAPFYGIGTQTNGIDILVPISWQFTRNPVLHLRYMHSANLNPEVSALNVLLNGRPVGSAPLDGTKQGEQQIDIELPRDEFQPGRINYLTFESVVKPTFECNIPPSNAIWIRVLGDSELHMPHTEIDEARIPSEDVRMFFTSRQDLGNVWFSLSETPTDTELAALTNTAWMLGRVSRGQGFAPLVTQGIVTDTTFLETFSVLTHDSAPDMQTNSASTDTVAPVIDDASLLAQYHVLAFGLPANNPLLTALNEELPQPFQLDENSLSQQIGNVIYRLPADMSLGVVEVMQTPWNPNRVVLATTGTSTQGLEWSVNALNSDLVTELTGDVNFVVQGQVEAMNSAQIHDVPVRESVERLTDEDMDEEIVLPSDDAADAANADDATDTTNMDSVLPDIPANRAEQYVPQQTQRSWTMTIVIIGLITTGVLIGLIGVLLNWRNGRTRNAGPFTPMDTQGNEDEAL